MLNHIVEFRRDATGREIVVWRIPAYRSMGKNSLPSPSPRPTGSMEKNGRSGGDWSGEMFLPKAKEVSQALAALARRYEAGRQTNYKVTVE